jgi:large subunit ribosomal protein L10
MAQPEKIEAVADLKVKLEEKPNFILVSYSGLNVKLMEELRKKLRENDSRLKVIKNNLFLRALKESKNHSEKTIKLVRVIFDQWQ